MKIVLHAIEVHGMPRLVVDQPVRESGDGIRLSNWAQDRYKDLKDMCEIHKGVTEKLRAECGMAARGLSWRELWAMVFDKQYKEHHDVRE